MDPELGLVDVEAAAEQLVVGQKAKVLSIRGYFGRGRYRTVFNDWLRVGFV